MAQALLVRFAVRTAQPCASSRTRASWWLTWCRWAATAVAPGAGRSTAVSWRLRAQAIAAGRAGLVDQLGVGQVQRRGSGVVQPGVAAAYPNQAGASGRRPAEGRAGPERRGRRGGQRRHRPLLLDTTEHCSSPALIDGVPPTVSRMASAWAGCAGHRAGSASTFHAMDESAVPALQDPSPRILSETLLGAFRACTHRHAGPRRCWLDRSLIRRRSMGCWPGIRGPRARAGGGPPPWALEPGRGSLDPCDDSSPRPARTRGVGLEHSKEGRRAYRGAGARRRAVPPQTC